MSKLFIASFCRMYRLFSHDQAGHNCCYESCTTPQPRPNCSCSVRSTLVLAKEIQWMNTDRMGEEKLVVMLWGTPHRVSSSQGNRNFALSKRVDRCCCASLDNNNWMGGVISDFGAHHAHKIRTSSHCILVIYTPTQGIQEVGKICRKCSSIAQMVQLASQQDLAVPILNKIHFLF